MPPNINANRREMMRYFGRRELAPTGSAAPRASQVSSRTPFKALAASPKSMADHRALAKYYRAMVAEREAEAKAFETLAAQYAKGLPDVTGDTHTSCRERLSTSPSIPGTSPKLSSKWPKCTRHRAGAQRVTGRIKTGG